jgi:YidC/Oxa1 family membrane protein insertase
MAEPTNGAPGSNQPSGGTEMSMEKRLLLAFVLMIAVLFLTPYFFRQPPRPPSAKQEAPQTQDAKSTPAVQPQQSRLSQPAAIQVPGQVAADKEESFLIDTDLYRIEFSNRGAVVRSWILKKYKDTTGKQVDLVNQTAVAKTGYPFSIVLPGPKPPVDLDQALYAPKPTADGLGVAYEYSNGQVLSRKTFHFKKDSYLADLSFEVVADGKPIPALLAWRGGFGDRQVPNAWASQRSVYFDLTANKLVISGAKDAKNGPVSAEGAYSFAGIEDNFFAAVFLPEDGSSVKIQTRSDTVSNAPGAAEQPHVGAAVGSAGENRFSLFVGPKDMDILKKVNPGLVNLVDFGWFAFIAKPLFLALSWTNVHFVHNYGWSIVLVTIVINFLLLPLKFTSLKSMKKMQLLQPQIAAINERYKGIGIRDPRKAEQNQEVMELYKKHGVNPMGGCVPMLLQIPFFYAFYKVLSIAIEMRGASWLWVTDLSQPEHLPIHILPVTMILTQFILQKMTPATTGDPTQQRMMLMMPLVMGFMFYGLSSGLVLYWLTGNLVGIAQQVFFNRMSSAPAIVTPEPARKKKALRK